jgi:hypothetical protein
VVVDPAVTKFTALFSVFLSPPLHPFSKNIAMNMLPHEKSVLGLLSRIRV